jgi:SAM-dependent methyltransferase
MKLLGMKNKELPPTETVNQCPLCGGDRIEPLFLTWDRLHRLPGEFALVLCPDCQLVRLSPRPVVEQIDFYYPEQEYYSYLNPVGFNPSPRNWRARLAQGIRDSILYSKGYEISAIAGWQRALGPALTRVFGSRIPYGYGERFPGFQPEGRALEIGCGSGIFLSYLRCHGWQVAGVELSRTAATAAKRAYDIDVFVGPLESAPFEGEMFDYIHMSHVIEHLPDPVKILQTVRGLLKRNGTLYIETPNVESYGRKKSGPHWFAWESPRHLCLFTPATLRRALAQAGMVVKSLRTSVEVFYEWEEVYKLEEREQRSIPDRPLFPARPSSSLAVRFRNGLALLSRHFRHSFSPLDGEIIHCWSSKA